LQAAQKDLRGAAREKSTSGGVLSRYVVARRLIATKHMRLFQHPAKVQILGACSISYIDLTVNRYSLKNCKLTALIKIKLRRCKTRCEELA
jgi:hypothetical protein